MFKFDNRTAYPLTTRSTFPADKRWRDRQVRWRPPGETINPREFGVDIVRESDAKAFVTAHPYSGIMPASRLSVGLYRKTGVTRSRLVGVAVFSVPMQAAAIPRYTGFSLAQGVELGRFVLLPEVALPETAWASCVIPFAIEGAFLFSTKGSLNVRYSISA